MKRIITLGLAFGLLASTAATADTFLRYGEVEGWKVFVDQDKKSCLIEAVDDVENVVQMGLTEDRGVGYVGVFTKAKTDIKRGDTEAVAILLGDNIYIGEATGMKGNITKGIRVGTSCLMILSLLKISPSKRSWLFSPRRNLPSPLT